MLDDEVVEAVAIGNLKAISEQPAMLSNLAYSNLVSSNNLGQQNAVANQQSVTELGIPLVAKAANTVSQSNPLQARSAVDILTNNELAQTITDLKSAVQALGTQGGKKPWVWSKLVKALLELGVHLNESGHLIVPKSVSTVRIPGNFTREDVRVRADQDGLVIEIKAS